MLKEADIRKRNLLLLLKRLRTCLTVVLQTSRFNNVINHLTRNSEAHRLWSITSRWTVIYVKKLKKRTTNSRSSRATINRVWRRLVIVQVSNCQFNRPITSLWHNIQERQGRRKEFRTRQNLSWRRTKEAIHNLSEAAEPIKIDGGNHWRVDGRLGRELLETLSPFQVVSFTQFTCQDSFFRWFLLRIFLQTISVASTKSSMPTADLTVFPQNIILILHLDIAHLQIVLILPS